MMLHQTKSKMEVRKMKRILVISGILVLSMALAASAMAADGMARVRAIHASPDAPAVDIWVNGAVAFSNAPFKGITDYAELAPDSYQIQVSPTGATEPIVIDATLDLAADTDYSIVAVGKLENIEPLVLIDNNSAPAAGKAHVRFVHASPDAPAVDIAVTGGPVLFSNVPFKGVGDYLPVDAGTYDLEVRIAGTETVALSVPGVSLADGTVYTIFAMGLAEGEPALMAVPSVDASYPVATTLPVTGGETTNLWLMLGLSAGLALVAGGLLLRNRQAKITIEE
jgi:LPXTG-motif cell wall-anchored protein